MKKVKITFDWWTAVLEVDETAKTLEGMKNQLLFWMSGQDRIESHHGDIESAYLTMLAQRLISLSTEYNTRGVKDEFKDAEGWLPIDGSHGVNLISVDGWEFGQSDFSIEVASD